jgi:hypothetical protein
MRKILVLSAAIAAVSCGGTSSNLSREEAQSVASEISAALQSHEAVASGRNQLSFGGGTSVSYTCAGGGTLDVSGSLNVNCPGGLRTCTTSGTLSVDADQCTTSAGAVIDGTVTATVTGIGLSFTKTVSGELTVTKPDGTTASCSVDVTVTFGHLSGTICGVSVSK